MLRLELPFPPASLSGHANGSWKAHHAETQKQRKAAYIATLAAMKGIRPVFPEGDIPIHFRFVPPDRRSDRTNFPARMKASIDGVADALAINDRRFKPSYEFAEPEKPGRVEIVIGEMA
jgi:crossover junction endodeoxyribonuclease RusA